MCAESWVKQKDRMTLQVVLLRFEITGGPVWGRLATRVFEWWLRRANPSRVKWKLKPLLNYWQYRLLPGQSIILAFLAPLTLFLVVTSQIWPPPPLWVKNCSSKVSIFVFMFCEWLTPVRMRDHDCDLKSDQNDTDIDTGTLTPIPKPVKINS